MSTEGSKKMSKGLVVQDLNDPFDDIMEDYEDEDDEDGEDNAAQI